MGLSLVISIEQKIIGCNLCLIVGMVMEVYDFFCFFYVCIGEVYSYEMGKKMVSYMEE